MNQPLAARPIEDLHRLGKRTRYLAGGRGTHLLDGGAQGTALRAVERRMGLGLAHALLGGFDSRHDDSQKEKVKKGEE
jgi:hypothetical protein